MTARTRVTSFSVLLDSYSVIETRRSFFDAVVSSVVQSSDNDVNARDSVLEKGGVVVMVGGCYRCCDNRR